MKRYIWFIICLVGFNIVSAQDATPMPPIVVQSNPNLGNVQPISLRDVTGRVGVAEWQNAGYTGAGYKIGILDRGFGGLLAFEQNTNRAVTMALGGDKTAYNSNFITHGTQVMEVIHAIAPGAELVACEYADLNRFIECIDWMQRYGINIINHSAGVPAQPLNGQGRWAQEANRALSANILWVNSAGNFAQGYYSERLTDRNLNRLHEFGGFAGEVETLGVAGIDSATQGVVMLSWQGTPDRAANTIDIDLQILNTNSGEVIASSYNQQAGLAGQEPLEYLTLDMRNDFAVQIIDTNGEAAGVEFSLFVEFAGVPGGQLLSSIIAPADSAGSLTVGALQGFDVAPYSSRGPLATGTLGIDLVAPGEIQLDYGGRFVGTSAAAPVVAGTAALLWQANPNLTAVQLRSQIITYTETQGIPDANVGSGRLLLPFPQASVEVALAPTLTPAVAPPTATATLPPLTATPNIAETQLFVTISALETQIAENNTAAIQPTLLPTTAIPATPTTAPTEVAAVPELGMSLENPVTSNSQWTPIERDFDGVTMVMVPAGSFAMGSTPEEIDFAFELCQQAADNGAECERSWFEDEAPNGDNTQTFAEPFWIDKYEVTRAQYQQCVDAGVCEATPDSQYSAEPNQPINRVTWFEAQAYCEWRDGRLPTEAEWEYAARGPDGLIFPWGNDFAGTEANHCDSNCGTADWGSGFNYVNEENDDGFAITAPVGSYDNDSWVGAYDMSGNVWEWVSSLYMSYDYSSDDGREGFDNRTDDRVLRGGGFVDSSLGVRAAFRNGSTPVSINNDIGVRCARS